MLKRGTAVQVRWLDSCGYGGGWIKHHEAEKWATIVGTIEHRTVGFFFAVTDDALIVAQSMVDYDDGAEPCVNACMAIPVVALRSLRVLK